MNQMSNNKTNNDDQNDGLFYGTNRRTIDEVKQFKHQLDNGIRTNEWVYQDVKKRIIKGEKIQLTMVDRIRMITEFAQEKRPIYLPENQGSWDFNPNSNNNLKQELNEYKHLPKFDGNYNNCPNIITLRGKREQDEE